MNCADDEQFAGDLARLRPRAFSTRVGEEIANQLDVEEPGRRRAFGRRFWKIAAACAAALFVIASSIVWRWEPELPSGQLANETAAPRVATESPLAWHPTSYGVLRRALADSPESLIVQLEESQSSAVLPAGRVWRVTDHHLALEEETY